MPMATTCRLVHHWPPIVGRRGSLAELLADPAEPLVGGDAVGPELLEPVLFLAEKDAPILAQLAGVRGVEHVAGVGRAHLEQHPHLELAKDLVGEVAVQVIDRVAPGDHVHAQSGPSRRITSRWSAGLASSSRLREAEVVLAAAEVAEPRQIVDEQEQLGPVGLRLLPCAELGPDFGEDRAARHASRRRRRRAASAAATLPRTPALG